MRSASVLLVLSMTCLGAGPGPAPAAASTAGDVSELAPLAREGFTAICDSLRDRMLVVTGTGDGLMGHPGVYARPLDGSGEWVHLPAGDGPGRRVYASIVLDTVHDRLVLFGGRAHSTYGPFYNDVWTLPLDGSGTWTLLAPSGAPPSARSGAAAVFDPVTSKMFLYGGGESNQNELWTLSLGASPAWEKFDFAIPLPTRTPSAVLDPVRRRMVVFGGFTNTGAGNETWYVSLDNPAAGWSRIFTAGDVPPDRRGHVAVYEPALDAMLVFGGETVDAYLVPGDVWRLSFAGTPQWTVASPADAGPGGRSRSGALFDRNRSRMVVIAGNVFGGVTAKVHALSTAGGFAWSSLDASDVPAWTSQRQSSFYDPVRDRLVVVGGRINGPRAIAINFQGHSIWTEVAAGSVQKPSARAGAAGAYDPVRDRFIVFGGGTGELLGGFPGSAPYADDTWSLDLTPADVWTPLYAWGPSGRTGAVMSFDPIRDRMLLFGGYDAAGSHNDVWQLPLSGPDMLLWTQLTPSGTPPAARVFAIMTYDAVHDRMIVAGGRTTFSSSTGFDDVWTLSLGSAPAWALVSPVGTPPEIGPNPGFYDPVRDRFVVRSRESGGERCLTSSLDLDPTPTWITEIPGGDRNRSTDLASMVHDPGRDRALVFGGEYDRRVLYDIAFGQPTRPRLTSAGEQAWSTGEIDLVPFTVTNPFPFPQTVDWTARNDRGWPGLPASGSVVVAALDSAIIQVPVPVPDSAAIGVNRIHLHAMLRTTQQPADAAVSLHDVTTAALVSLASAVASPGRVRIVWSTGLNGARIEVERSLGAGGWTSLQSVIAEAQGWIRFEDTDVVPGRRQGYRLRLGDGTVAGEVWVDVPAALDFALIGARPNPAAGDVTIAFRLPDTAPARLELIDLAGRAARSLDLARPEPGAQVIALDPDRTLPAGLYFARLTQGALRQIRRVTIVR